jgi:hypothetical protein
MYINHKTFNYMLPYMKKFIITMSSSIRKFSFCGNSIHRGITAEVKTDWVLENGENPRLYLRIACDFTCALHVTGKCVVFSAS